MTGCDLVSLSLVGFLRRARHTRELQHARAPGHGLLYVRLCARELSSQTGPLVLQSKIAGIHLRAAPSSNEVVRGATGGASGNGAQNEGGDLVFRGGSFFFLVGVCIVSSLWGTETCRCIAM